MLDRRPGVDPLTVAGHARLGGDLALASRALRDASARAAERHDYAAAETLLDDALRLDACLVRLAGPGPGPHPARALRRGIGGRGVGRTGRPGGVEVGAWASYFGRDFAQAAQFAADGALAADDAATRARCLAAGGWTHHAAGDLAQAELLLGEAFSLAEGADRVAGGRVARGAAGPPEPGRGGAGAAAPGGPRQIGWSTPRPPCTRCCSPGTRTPWPAARPEALAALARYTAEVERRQVPRFAGRRGVLHRLGAGQPGRPAGGAGPPPGGAGGRAGPGHCGRYHRRAGRPGRGTAWRPGIRTARGPGWPRRRRCCGGNLVFGWRLRLKHQLLTGAWRCWPADGEQGRWRGPASSSRRRPRWACRGTPASPGCSRPGRPRARRAGGWTRTRWPPTLTCSTAPRRSRRGGGPATWPRLRPARLAGAGRRPGRAAGAGRGDFAVRAAARGGPAADPGPPAPGSSRGVVVRAQRRGQLAAPPPERIGSPTTRAPRRSRRAPSPSRTGRSRRAGTAPAGAPTTDRCRCRSPPVPPGRPRSRPPWTGAGGGS